MDKEIFKSVIKDIIRHSDDIFELKISAPLAAKNYLPGQFFKLQNFHNKSSKSFEPIAITASNIEGNIISSIIQIVGQSTKSASLLKKGEEVSLVGPCGEASYLPSGSSFLLIGGGVGVYALLPYAKRLKENNNKVLMLCGYRKKEHFIYENEIKKLADKFLFTFDEKIEGMGEECLQGSIIDGLAKFPLENIKNLFVVGSSSMMQAVSAYLEDYKALEKIASINAPMQCMLGGVCGQCLTLVPSASGDKLVFICKNQDQKLHSNLMSNLKKKLRQNSLLEKI